MTTAIWVVLAALWLICASYFGIGNLVLRLQRRRAPRAISAPLPRPAIRGDQ
jgi:hypothetical protein